MKFRSLWRPVAASAMAATLMLTACNSDSTSTTSGSAEGKDALDIAVVTPYLSNASTKEVIDLFQKEGEDRGWKVSVTDTAGDMNKLNSAFQDAAARKPDAIVMGMGDPTQVSLGLKAASDAGIPVVAIDAAVADGIIANVTSDNTDLGQQSAQALIDAMGGSGDIVMLTHDPHPGVKARAEGAKALFDEKGITVIEAKHVEVPGPVDNARTAVQDLITARGDDIKGIWGGWDEPALGAVQALDAAGKKIPVVGVDGQDFAIEEINKGGNFVATVKQDWAAIATKTADILEAEVVDGTDPGEQQVQLPGKLVTKG